MIRRPLSVTIVCWVLIVLGALGLAGTLQVLHMSPGRAVLEGSSLPMGAQLVLVFAGSAVSMSCGLCMLKGANWARWLYIAFSTLRFAVALFTTADRMPLIPGVAVFLILSCFLLMPTADAYFTQDAGRGA